MFIIFYVKKSSKYILPVFALVFLLHTKGYAVGGLGIVSFNSPKVESSDIDNDGIIDSQDSFPYNHYEWKDSDQDGIGNNSDSDDDNDGMPDNWEVKYNLDPFSNDAAGDMDEDGIDNITEYQFDTDPAFPESDPEDLAYNNAPYTPGLSLPADESIDMVLIPEFHVNSFLDPDQGDLHALTDWQVSLVSDFSSLVLERRSNMSLVSTTIPGSLLKEGTEYFWRVRFYDNHQAESEWSEIYSFTTISDYPVDDNGNDIPDDQEVDGSVDLDQDDTPDKFQNDIMSLNNEVMGTQIGIKGFTNVVEFEAVKLIDPDTISELDNEQTDMPFGLISFRLLVENPGDVATVKIYLSEPAPPEAIWYKYDTFSGGLYDYSDYAIFGPDRTYIVLELKDGGYGDMDGIENGVIVDPGGIFISPEIESGGENSSVAYLKSNIDESKGCFIIHTSISEMQIVMKSVLLILLIVGMVTRVILKHS